MKSSCLEASKLTCSSIIKKGVSDFLLHEGLVEILPIQQKVKVFLDTLIESKAGVL
jgi:hypothetical protein